MSTTVPDRADGHAVVIGASAGLLAAPACADHFEHVTLIDRDAPGDSAQSRKGVPQTRMLQLLLPGGLQIIDRLLPGYSAELEAAGAVPVLVPTEGLTLSPRRAGRPLPATPGQAQRRPVDAVHGRGSAVSHHDRHPCHRRNPTPPQPRARATGDITRPPSAPEHARVQQFVTRSKENLS